MPTNVLKENPLSSMIYFMIRGYVSGAVVDHNQLPVRRQSLIGGGNEAVHFSCRILSLLKSLLADFITRPHLDIILSIS
jgi:hypothetical protein